MKLNEYEMSKKEETNNKNSHACTKRNILAIIILHIH